MRTILFAVAVAVGIFSLLWWYLTKSFKKVFGDNATVTFVGTDEDGNRIPFEPRHERYMKIAEVITTPRLHRWYSSQVSASTVMCTHPLLCSSFLGSLCSVPSASWRH